LTGQDRADRLSVKTARDWKVQFSQETKAVDDTERKPAQDHNASIFEVDIDDAAIELAATSVGTIPTASVNMVPPNCCVQQKR
jgi:hypothetical protein